MSKRAELEDGEIQALEIVQEQIQALRKKKQELERPAPSGDVTKPPPPPREEPPQSSTRSTSRSRGSRSPYRRRRRRRRSYSRSRSPAYRRRRGSRSHSRGRRRRSTSRDRGRRRSRRSYSRDSSRSSDRRSSSRDRSRRRKRRKIMREKNEKQKKEEALRLQAEEEKLKRQLAMQQLQEHQRLQQARLIQEQQEEIFRQQEKRKKKNELKRFLHGTVLKLKNQKLNQLADNRKKTLQQKFQQKLDDLNQQHHKQAAEKDEFGVLIPPKPDDPGILQTIEILVPFVLDYGEKLIAMLKERLNREPDPLFQFLFDTGTKNGVYYNYFLDKSKKKRKKQSKTRFGPRVVSPSKKKAVLPPKKVRPQPYTMTSAYRDTRTNVYNPISVGYSSHRKSDMYDPLGDTT